MFAKPTRRISAHCLVFPFLTSLLLPLLLPHTAGAQQRIQIQQRRPFGVQLDDIDPFSNSGLALPQPPRELRRALQAAERAVKEEEFSEAVESLNLILDSKSSEDFFLPGKSGSALSLKRRALDLLGAMPTKGREIYELQVRSQARQMLNEAVESFEIGKIKEVSRRFFHSTVGYEATMLLARYELDQGHSLAAAMHLMRLQNAPAAKTQLGNEVPLLLSLCWYMAGQEEAASRVLTENLAQLAGKEIQIGGVATRIPRQLDDPKAWLKSAVGAGVALKLAKGDNWKLFRGGPNRNASVPGGMPIGKMEWEVPLAAANPADAAKILEWHRENQDNLIPLIPAMQPLGVGNYLLMRTARMMFGVELSTGRRTWPYPDEALEATNKPVTPTINANFQYRATGISDPLRQRIWQDAPYAQLSSDGERVFLLRDLQIQSRSYATNNLALQRGMAPAERSNSLVALELESEGKLLWKAGGADSNDPQLTGAFFLGVPLPLDNHLYVIAEIKDELKLLSIDAGNGMLDWSQQLIQLEGSVLDPGSLRRLAGATPSFAEGLLICPTSNGAVVAIELASRSLLWGATYQMKQTNRGNFNRNPFGTNIFRNMRMPIAGTHWVDSTVVIEDGRVLLTPVEADRLVCLDLLTGNPAWPAIPREDMLYVGAVHDQVALMIGSRSIRGIRLSDGKPAWDNIELDEGEYPTGRGFVTDGHYFLPSSRSEILRIRIADGTIAERQPMDRPLGNIICHADYMISQSPEGVFAYPLRERRRGQIVRMLKESPNNPDALEDYANLLAADGKNEQAIEAMQRAMTHSPGPERKSEMESLLSRIMINALRDDFPAFKQHLPVAQKITTSPDARVELAKIVVNGTRDLPQSFAAQLELVDATINKQLTDTRHKSSIRRLSGEPNYRRSHLLDVAAELVKTTNQAGDRKGELTAMLTDRLQKQEFNSEQMSSWAQVGNQLATRLGDPSLARTMNEINLRLGDKLIADNQPILAALTLNRLRKAGNAETATVASAKLAGLYESQGRYQQAAAEYDSLQKTAGDAVLLDGKTGNQLASSFFSRYQAELSPTQWNEGRLKVETTNQTTSTTTSRRWYPIRILSATGDWPDGMTLVLNQRANAIIAMSPSGTPLFSVNTKARYTPTHRGCHARIYGNVAIVSTGNSIVAIDLLSRDSEQDDNSRLLWRYETQKKSPTSGRSHLTTNTPEPWNSILKKAFEEKQYHFFDGSGQPVGWLGPVSYNGVAIMSGGAIHCLDLKTGRPRWIRDGFRRNLIFGDDQVVYTSNPLTGKTEAFDLSDGEAVGTYKVPQARYHWRPWGRHLIYYSGSHSTGHDLQLRMFDAKSKKDVWTIDLTAGFKAHFFSPDEFAILQKNGTFGIYSAETGKPRFETRVEVDPTFLPPRVIKGADDYILATDHNDQPYYSKLLRAGVRIQMPTQGHPMQQPSGMTGMVYRFDGNGETTWKHPVKVGQFAFLNPVPYDSPVLAFLRFVQTTKKIGTSRTRKTRTDVFVVDRRSGQLVWETTKPNLPQFTYIESNPGEQVATMTIPGIQRVSFDVTDKPFDSIDDKQVVLERIPLPKPEKPDKAATKK